jgi:hypothetical protein
MRTILFLLVLSPFIAFSQINRSARELAKENIQDYLSSKIFRNQPINPVSFGELVRFKKPDPEITWTIEHRFELVKNSKVQGHDSTIRQPYKFVFYLDEKLKVYKAESFSTY